MCENLVNSLNCMHGSHMLIRLRKRCPRNLKCAIQIASWIINFMCHPKITALKMVKIDKLLQFIDQHYSLSRSTVCARYLFPEFVVGNCDAPVHNRYSQLFQFIVRLWIQFWIFFPIATNFLSTMASMFVFLRCLWATSPAFIQWDKTTHSVWIWQIIETKGTEWVTANALKLQECCIKTNNNFKNIGNAIVASTFSL